MDISALIPFRHTSLKFEKNESPPPDSIIQVRDTVTDELIRQIPGDEKKRPEELDEKAPQKENSIDVYA